MGGYNIRAEGFLVGLYGIWIESLLVYSYIFRVAVQTWSLRFRLSEHLVLPFPFQCVNVNNLNENKVDSGKVKYLSFLLRS